MADDDTESLPDRKRNPWTSQDRRLLIITFIGGLAANIGVVLVLGLAIGLIHAVRAEPSTGLASLSSSHLPSFMKSYLAFWLTTMTGGVIVLGLTVIIMYKTRVSAWVWKIMAGLWAFYCTLLLLTLVGLAAGVK